MTTTARKFDTLHISIMPIFKPGDPPPAGYSEWHEWAEVQTKAGLSQTQCATCHRWYFPQEKHDCEVSR